jgi:hypothetical protein
MSCPFVSENKRLGLPSQFVSPEAQALKRRERDREELGHINCYREDKNHLDFAAAAAAADAVRGSG